MVKARKSWGHIEEMGLAGNKASQFSSKGKALHNLKSSRRKEKYRTVESRNYDVRLKRKSWSCDVKLMSGSHFHLRRKFLSLAIPAVSEGFGLHRHISTCGSLIPAKRALEEIPLSAVLSAGTGAKAAGHRALLWSCLRAAFRLPRCFD